MKRRTVYITGKALKGSYGSLGRHAPNTKKKLRRRKNARAMLKAFSDGTARVTITSKYS